MMTHTGATVTERAVPEITEKHEDLSIAVGRTEGADDVIVVQLSGQIDYYTNRYFGRQLRHLLECGETRYVLNFAGVSYVSSVGVGELLGFYREVRMSAGRIVLAGLGTNVREVLSLLGFASFFEYAPAVPEAVKLIQGTRPRSAFPSFGPCPMCGRKLRLTREGRFRCPECRTIVRVNNRAEVEAE